MGMNYVLLLREVPLHPDSVLNKLKAAYEQPSIIYVQGNDGLQRIKKKPMFNDKFLVIFEFVSLFKSSVSLLDLSLMDVVVICNTVSEIEDAKEICSTRGLKCKLHHNVFDAKAAEGLIRKLAKKEVSKDFCNALINRVGRSPQRILSAMMICDEVGYTRSNVMKYIDKYTYISAYDVLESLLGICRYNTQKVRAATFIYNNRVWYNKYTKNNLIKEVDILIKVFQDLISGSLTNYNLDEYLEENRLSRYKVMYARNLFEQKNTMELMELKYFLQNADVMEVALKLS